MIPYVPGPVDYEAVRQQVMVLIPMVIAGLILVFGWTWAFSLQGGPKA